MNDITDADHGHDGGDNHHGWLLPHPLPGFPWVNTLGPISRAFSVSQQPYEVGAIILHLTDEETKALSYLSSRTGILIWAARFPNLLHITWLCTSICGESETSKRCSLLIMRLGWCLGHSVTPKKPWFYLLKCLCLTGRVGFLVYIAPSDLYFSINLGLQNCPFLAWLNLCL